MNYEPCPRKSRTCAERFDNVYDGAPPAEYWTPPEDRIATKVVELVRRQVILVLGHFIESGLTLEEFRARFEVIATPIRSSFDTETNVLTFGDYVAVVPRRDSGKPGA